MKLKYILRSKIYHFLGLSELVYLPRVMVELNNITELKKVFHWVQEPILDDPQIYEFEYLENVNERRLRDAEVLGTIVRNVKPRVCLDIGTSTGHSAALMAINAPQARVFTVNIPPEELLQGQGGKLTTVVLERHEIGAYYRERNFHNVHQIFRKYCKLGTRCWIY